MTYTYEPTDIALKSISRARFELGDVMVDGGADTCMLSDEEIMAVMNMYSSWKTVLFKLADAVCMRLSYETDWRDDGTSFNLNQRVERWMQLRDKFKKDVQGETCVPQSGAVSDAVRNPEDGGHYFYGGMLNSPYVKPPMPFGGGDT